jgi:hypothetical protein
MDFTLQKYLLCVVRNQYLYYPNPTLSYVTLNVTYSCKPENVQT